MNTKIDFLKQNGIDYDTALNYMGDFETYNEILVDFYNGIDDQLLELQNSINDMSNYSILVHALKSNFRSLGMTKYAEIAYQHELESKALNNDFVSSNFNSLIEAKDSFKQLVSKYMGL